MVTWPNYSAMCNTVRTDLNWTMQHDVMIDMGRYTVIGAWYINDPSLLFHTRMAPSAAFAHQLRVEQDCPG